MPAWKGSLNLRGVEGDGNGKLNEVFKPSAHSTMAFI